MPISAECPHCHVSGQMDDSFAGKAVRCPECRRVFTVAGIPEAVFLRPKWSRRILILVVAAVVIVGSLIAAANHATQISREFIEKNSRGLPK